MKGVYKSPKRKRLLETGKQLFWKFGFRRVSIDEICKEADVSKMTFYRCFENKTDLAKTIYTDLVNDGIAKFNEIIYADISPSEKLQRILLMKMEYTVDISCEFLMDFYNSPDTELQIFVEKTTRNSWDQILKGFRYAQEMGWFRKDFKPEFLLYISQKMSSMTTDENLLKFYDSPNQLIMEFANFFTYGISPHD
jgi:AcrR family transcriptional regulator